jgi:hypothetical protein
VIRRASRIIQHLEIEDFLSMQFLFLALALQYVVTQPGFIAELNKYRSGIDARLNAPVVREVPLVG